MVAARNTGDDSVTGISYAQNFEDVMLARALADVEEGFYVDIGAQDPLIDSVTHMFYERGWKGINVEPVLHWYERLQADRPRDINLMCAVAASEGEVLIHESSESGLSTASEVYARNHAMAGWNMVERSVPSRRLDDILAEHARGVIHFLKIDVEGMEREVLESLSLDRFRPWILVIEATQPNTAVDVSQVWEESVLQAGYCLVYRDGLNRFYLAEEQLSRSSAFDVPPNVFDEFIPYREHASREYGRSLEQRLQGLHDQAEGFRNDLLTVTDTAQASQRRTAELEALLQERQGVLEETAHTAERYRIDLSLVAEAADNRLRRITELEQTVVLAHGELHSFREASERELQAVKRASAYELQAATLALQRELHAVALAAENRGLLIVDLETRLGRRECEFERLGQNLHVISVRSDGLQKQLDAVYASNSWRLTAPLRSLTGWVRGTTGPILRALAKVPILRKIGRLVLKGRVRRRALSLAGFHEQVDVPAVTRLSGEENAPVGPAHLSRAGVRVYGLLASASRRSEGQQ